MKRKKIRKTLFSFLLVVAVMFSFSTAAYAETGEFNFALPDEFEVKDVIILSEKSGENSVLKKAPFLFEQYTGEEIAEYVAYDRYLKGEDYNYELDEENGFVIFGITGPATILVPSKIIIPAEGDLKITVLCIDIPDGTKLKVNYTDGESSGSATVKVKDGIATFTIGEGELDNYKESEALEISIEYTLDGNMISEKANYPIESEGGNNGGYNGGYNGGGASGDGGNGGGASGDGGNGGGASGDGGNGGGASGDGGNGGGASGDGGNGGGASGDGGNGGGAGGSDSDFNHGIKIVGGGNEIGVKVDDNKIFNNVEPVVGSNDGPAHVEVWYGGGCINIPLEPAYWEGLFGGNG